MKLSRRGLFGLFAAGGVAMVAPEPVRRFFFAPTGGWGVIGADDYMFRMGSYPMIMSGSPNWIPILAGWDDAPFSLDRSTVPPSLQGIKLQ